MRAAVVQRATQIAERALGDFNAAMMGFRLALLRSADEDMETERERAVVAIGEYCDQLMVASREGRR